MVPAAMGAQFQGRESTQGTVGKHNEDTIDTVAIPFPHLPSKEEEEEEDASTRSHSIDDAPPLRGAAPSPAPSAAVTGSSGIATDIDGDTNSETNANADMSEGHNILSEMRLLSTWTLKEYRWCRIQCLPIQKVLQALLCRHAMDNDTHIAQCFTIIHRFILRLEVNMPLPNPLASYWTQTRERLLEYMACMCDMDQVRFTAAVSNAPVPALVPSVPSVPAPVASQGPAVTDRKLQPTCTRGDPEEEAGSQLASDDKAGLACKKGKGKGKGKGTGTPAPSPAAPGNKQVPSIQAAIDKLGQDYNALYLSNSQDQQGHLPPNDMVYDETRAGEAEGDPVVEEVVDPASGHGSDSDSSNSGADSPRSHQSDSSRSDRRRRSSSSNGSTSSSNSARSTGARGDSGSAGMEGQAGLHYNNDDATALLLGSTSSVDTTPSTPVYTESKPAPASPPPAREREPAQVTHLPAPSQAVRTSKSTSRVHAQQLLHADGGDRNRAQSAEQPGSRESAAQKKAISQNKRAAAVVVKKTRSRPSSGASRSSMSRTLSRQSMASHTS
eukprot:TRINITY_DN4944_c0_g1_i2.p1 TRINITY_DN4944_c0_g1~~TRINITY_DN4944_c0_g1_i2.p1  ORF type:complete len:554 (+),score=79.17 TRINITY_DN4944_c0_g1_i2:223-1884(+)